MSIGAGIAIAGMWGFAASCALSRSVTGGGMWMGVIAALAGTFIVAGLAH